MSFIKEKTTTTSVGPKGLPAYKSDTKTCQHCGHNEFERFNGAGVTEICST